MRPLRYSINVSLDGCIDHRAMRPDKDVFRYTTDILAQADALLFGRVTYEMMEAAWKPPASEAFPDWMQPFTRVMDRAKKYVVSSTLKSVDWNAELLRVDPGKDNAKALAEAVQRLKQQPGKGLYTGGVKLPTALADLGLIDEYEFFVHPSIVGQGPPFETRLFARLSKPLDLKLVGRKEFASGVVAMRYEPRR